VGDGPDRASLEQAVDAAGLRSSVIFTGAVNQDAIRQLYRDADIFVLASFAEGIPVVLMEAMAMGLPCVSTYIAGIPELIVDERDGLLVMPSDVEGLANALERLLRDPELRSRLGAAGRQRVVEKYDLKRNTENLAQIFIRRLGELGDSSTTMDLAGHYRGGAVQCDRSGSSAQPSRAKEFDG
jgi:glycosyltransferase involved in cell wall biosynthesis